MSIELNLYIKFKGDKSPSAMQLLNHHCNGQIIVKIYEQHDYKIILFYLMLLHLLILHYSVFSVFEF